VFARLHTIKTTPEQHEVGLQIVRDEFLPWVRESSGFRGLIGLVDEEREKAVVLTLWRDAAALHESAAAAEQLSRLADTASGAKRRSLESFEVTLFEVPR
jgi:heme-degrading monooxygenase HmoA